MTMDELCDAVERMIPTSRLREISCGLVPDKDHSCCAVLLQSETPKFTIIPAHLLDVLGKDEGIEFRGIKLDAKGVQLVFGERI